MQVGINQMQRLWYYLIAIEVLLDLSEENFRAKGRFDGLEVQGLASDDENVIHRIA